MPVYAASPTIMERLNLAEVAEAVLAEVPEREEGAERPNLAVVAEAVLEVQR